MNAQNVRTAKLNQYLGALPAFLASLANTIVLILGVHLAMGGSFTLGAVMMFQGFLQSFMSPAMTMIGASQTIQEMRTQMEYLDDVMAYPDDVGLEETPTQEDADLVKLRGDVELSPRSPRSYLDCTSHGAERSSSTGSHEPPTHTGL